MAESVSESDIVDLATELTIAWLGNGNTRVDAEDVPAFLQKIHATLATLATPAADEAPGDAEAGTAEPAVSVRKSLASKDHIISLIDGKPYKSLKRHLTNHGLTPDEYRARYGLKPDYPMVAPNYAQMRREFALKIGLGAKNRKAKPAPKAAPAKRGRKPAANGGDG